MYFYEVVKASDKETVIRKFLAMCDDSPDINRTEQKCRKVLESLCDIEPKISEYTIFIEKTVLLNGEPNDNVFIIDNAERCSLEANPWAETLGYLVDEKCLSSYSFNDITALVLWEITWFGFDEKSIQEHIASWDL